MPQVSVLSQHFRSDLTPSERREMFRESVDLVELETFTFCNRKCGFCPNHKMPDRYTRSANRYMDEGLYLEILDDLGSIGYSGDISYSRYNEPLADRIILARLRQARERVPSARLYTHTNGDYVTVSYLNELADAGLKHISIQVYPSNGGAFDMEALTSRQDKLASKLGLSVTPIHQSDVRRWLQAEHRGMSVYLDVRNFSEVGTDRGQIVQIGIGHTRTSPCFVPFQKVYVDYDGSVMPCCNLRSDSPSHQKYVVAKLGNGTSIFDAFAALWGWRRSLLTFGEKEAPCDTCRYDEIPFDLTTSCRLAAMKAAIPAPIAPK